MEGSSDIEILYNETRTVTYLVTDPDSHGFMFELIDPSGAISPRKDDERLYLDIRNYKRTAGTYTARVSVSDSFGATDAAEFSFTLLPNQPPVVLSEFTPVYFGSLNETAEFSPAAGFGDEVPETVTHKVEYDRNKLYLQSWGDGYRIMPLGFGASEITVIATDEDGLSTRSSFDVLCRDDSREIDLYPNPVVDRLTIRMGRSTEGAIRVSFYDASGRLALQCNSEIAPTRPAVLDLSTLGGGAYTVKIEYAGGSITRSIVKL